MSISRDLSKFEDIINRLKEAIGEKTDIALAERLGLTRQNIYAARQKDEVPPGWIFKISEETGYSLDWIKYGEEPKKLKRHAENWNALSNSQKLELVDKLENALNLPSISSLPDGSFQKTSHLQYHGENF